MVKVCYSLILSQKTVKEGTRRDAFKIIFQSTTLTTVIPKKAESAIPMKPIKMEQTISNKVTNWEGTSLNLMSPSDAINYLNVQQTDQFPMAKWPDPILRIASFPTPSKILNTPTLHRIGNALRKTARSNQAVGLAAQQCGIQISLIYLETPPRQYFYSLFNKNSQVNRDGIFLVNPRFIERSSESQMKVWTEECLVLPPDFHATVLRDSDILVEAENLMGQTFRLHLYGEQARAVQHECDHDRGILITDHVGADEMRDESMWMIEKGGHNERQAKAYDRYLGTPNSSINVAFVNHLKRYDDTTMKKNIQVNLLQIPTANAEDGEMVITCDENCKKRIEERRAMFKQSRSTRSRQEVFNLSKQRAALYNTTYQGSSCIDGLSCY